MTSDEANAYLDSLRASGRKVRSEQPYPNVYTVDVSCGAKQQWHGVGRLFAEAVEQVKAMMEKQDAATQEA